MDNYAVLSFEVGLVNIRLNTAAIGTIVTPELRTLVTIFEKYGFKNEIRIVGGAVRDLLNDQVPVDIDLATIATPQEMNDMFGAEKIHMINAKGVKHGTVTVRMNEKENFEISTLRNQTKVDGEVDNITFVKDWFVDSTRRDFTINAMYLDFEGNLYDYHNGYEDLQNNRVRFIGEANARIREDPILIPRYFRFFARIAKHSSHHHDEKVLQAIRDHASKLDRIFGERIWSELQRIFVSNFVQDIVKLMLKLGLAPHMGLGGNLNDLDIICFDRACDQIRNYKFRATTLVASLLRRIDQVLIFSSRMKLSRFDRVMMYTILKLKNESLPAGDDECFKYLQRILVFSFANQEAIHVGIAEVLKIANRGAVTKLISKWTVPKLRIDQSILKERGIVGKRRVGELAKKLKEAWFDNAYVLSDDLFNRLLYEFQNKTDSI